MDGPVGAFTRPARSRTRPYVTPRALASWAPSGRRLAGGKKRRGRRLTAPRRRDDARAHVTPAARPCRVAGRFPCWVGAPILWRPSLSRRRLSHHRAHVQTDIAAVQDCRGSGSIGDTDTRRRCRSACSRVLTVDKRLRFMVFSFFLK